MNRARLLPLLTLLAILVSACAPGPNAGDPIYSRDSGGYSALLTGLSKTDMDAYATRFRQTSSSPTDGGQADITRTVTLDPDCPLEYAYDYMADGSDPGGRLREVNATSDSGFINPARGEVLIVLRGYGFSRNNLKCAAPGYLPARINLVTGVWSIDGWATPAANVTVSVQSAYAPAGLENDNKPRDEGALVSPMRLLRFRVTDENIGRVTDYATTQSNFGPSRRIVWFRYSDVAPLWDAYVSAGCTRPLIAFWGKAAEPCAGSPLQTDFTDDSPLWIDDQARMGADPVWDDAGVNTDGGDADDIYCLTWCDQLGDDGWKAMAGYLGTIATDVTPSAASRTAPGPDRAQAIAALRELLSCAGDTSAACSDGDPSTLGNNASALADNQIPDELGGWANPDPDVFGVIASGGHEAFESTRKNTEERAALNGWATWFGVPGQNGKRPTENTVTLSPSFSYLEVENDNAAADFYDSHSFLFSASGGGRVLVMHFATSQTGSRDSDDSALQFEQSPLHRFEITVSDPLNGANTQTYGSDWIPTYLVYRNGPDISRPRNDSIFTDFGKTVSNAIYDFFYDFYRGTFGVWLSDLSRAATQNMLSVPIMERYQVRYVTPLGTKVYELNEELVKPDQSLDTLNEAEARCTDAALNGRLVSPSDSYADCFRQNPMYFLFGILRGLMFALMLIFIARYFIAANFSNSKRTIDTDSKRMPIFGFLARIVFVMALILGIEVVTRILSLVVAEAILMTNLIGTQVGQGEPYSHLWLFSKYLNSPARGENIFSLIAVSLFAVLGLLAVVIVNFARSAVAYLVLALAPFWVVSILNDPDMRLFFSSLRLVLRLYLIPIMTLCVLLMLFVIARLIGLDHDSLLGAVFGMLMMLIVIIAPIWLSKLVMGKVMAPIRAAITNAKAWADRDSNSAWMDATASASGGKGGGEGGLDRQRSTGAQKGGDPRAAGEGRMGEPGGRESGRIAVSGRPNPDAPRNAAVAAAEAARDRAAGRDANLGGRRENPYADAGSAEAGRVRPEADLRGSSPAPAADEGAMAAGATLDKGRTPSRARAAVDRLRGWGLAAAKNLAEDELLEFGATKDSYAAMIGKHGVLRALGGEHAVMGTKDACRRCGHKRSSHTASSCNECLKAGDPCERKGFAGSRVQGFESAMVGLNTTDTCRRCQHAKAKHGAGSCSSCAAENGPCRAKAFAPTWRAAAWGGRAAKHGKSAVSGWEDGQRTVAAQRAAAQRAWQAAEQRVAEASDEVERAAAAAEATRLHVAYEQAASTSPMHNLLRPRAAIREHLNQRGEARELDRAYRQAKAAAEDLERDLAGVEQRAAAAAGAEAVRLKNVARELREQTAAANEQVKAARTARDTRNGTRLDAETERAAQRRTLAEQRTAAAQAEQRADFLRAERNALAEQLSAAKELVRHAERERAAGRMSQLEVDRQRAQAAALDRLASGKREELNTAEAAARRLRDFIADREHWS